jgi:hypothetical protein
MILIIDLHGWRFCNDGYWRDFAMFGNVKGCVKQYKTVGRAKRHAKKVMGQVVQVPQGMEVDASGSVIETVPCADKPNYEMFIHHKLTEFLLEK